jgi:hypothetical protein
MRLGDEPMQHVPAGRRLRKGRHEAVTVCATTLQRHVRPLVLLSLMRA